MRDDPADVDLDRYESMLRADFAVVWNGVQTKRMERLGRLEVTRFILTTDRIIFAPPSSSRTARTVWKIFLMPFAKRGPRPPPFPVLDRRTITLAAVTRLWKWEPEFSGNPMLSVLDRWTDSYSFQLADGDTAVPRPASVEAVRDHFEALEAAWIAARDRASHRDAAT